ncbi:hypothetical protein, partial [Haloferula sp.]|uniref:hypothetical protein n=1 Tax=Haloferula sp. TaxID=2497595 RepID=UPI003C7749A1
LKSRVSVMEQTTDWRAGCGRSACPVRRGERRKPMRRSYLYPGFDEDPGCEGEEMVGFPAGEPGTFFEVMVRRGV